jgi:hypothetical protein
MCELIVLLRTFYSLQISYSFNLDERMNMQYKLEEKVEEDSFPTFDWNERGGEAEDTFPVTFPGRHLNRIRVRSCDTEITILD